MITSKGLLGLGRQLRALLPRNISKLSGRLNQEVVTGKKASEINLQDCTGMTKLVDKRALSTKLKTLLNPILFKNVPPLFSKEDEREFMAPFPNLLHYILDECHFKDATDVTNRFERLLDYTVPDMKWATGLTTLAVYKGLERPELLTKDAIKKAALLSWCVELLMETFIIMDDIMDETKMRLGMPCWYRCEGIGLSAVNDAILLEQGLYSILRRHFSQHPCYVPLMELFQEVTLRTAMGQSQDNMHLKDGMPNFDIFTLDRLHMMLDYKLGCIYHLQVKAPMHLCNRFDEEQHRQVRSIINKTGQLAQARNDFIDCFGDPSRIGKDSTDIQHGKFTWPVVMALKISSKTQRKMIREHYGRKSDESEAIVRRIYDELDLPGVYAAYEDERLKLINKEVEQLNDKELPHELFLRIMKFMLDAQSSAAPVLEH